MSTRGGRRPGDSGTRAAILDTARVSFAESGYAGTTIRGVAGRAGVDPALVHHFFGTKDDLFLAALALPEDFMTGLPQPFEGDRATVGERMTRRYLSLWEDPVTGAALRSVVRSTFSHEAAAALLREFIGSQVLAGAAARLDVDSPELRVALAGSHLFGLAVARYVVGIEPLARAQVDALVAAVAPAVQHYLTGDLAGGGTTHPAGLR